ncbi:hypothetical protein B0T25DRAFT_534512 [Lasiosphaeria hispida]|uniref:Uncharacterized protein n=1 Tax=Lasiosphaeria hispida TaxID=260671 RepID=A0AAJ0HRQ3_9PEZI|nr:hypothetical protein B0T25DRAFT_534512 [Lasiosphaeria hispida]
MEGIPSLLLTITLPKASLLGSGVSLTATSVFGEPAPLSAVALRLDSLRVPTLVGVNSNERLAKQIVWTSKDFYTELETLVVQFWDIHVRMEKPTAVPLADCPILEVRRMSNNS